MEAEGRLFCALKLLVVCPGGLQKLVSPHYIGAYELTRPVYRAVHMGLGGQMHNMTGTEAGKNLAQSGPVTDINAVKLVIRVLFNALQRFEIAGVGEFVNNADLVFALRQDMTRQSRTDKAGTAGNQNTLAHMMPFAPFAVI